MTLNEYQSEAEKTAIYGNQSNVIYPVLGLVDEASEVLEKIANKIDWSNKQNISFEDIFTQVILYGKAAGKLKKEIRDTKNEWIHKQIVNLAEQIKNLPNSNELKQDITKELGDVLWYIAILARDFGITLDEIGQTNIAKLRDRQLRGKLGGSGDER